MDMLPLQGTCRQGIRHIWLNQCQCQGNDILGLYPATKAKGGRGGALLLCGVTKQYNTRGQMSYFPKPRFMNTPIGSVSM